MSKIIVDTSVWIDFFKGRLSPALSSQFNSALENEQVVVTDIIVHELLVGTLTKKKYNEMQDLLSALFQLRIEQNMLEDFNEFAWQCHRKGWPGKYTDITIAYLSHVHHHPVLSFDHFFHKLDKAGFIQTIKV